MVFSGLEKDCSWQFGLFVKSCVIAGKKKINDKLCILSLFFQNQKAAERKCPTCKSKAKLADVRNLYGHRIQMIDTTELEEFRGKNKEVSQNPSLLLIFKQLYSN